MINNSNQNTDAYADGFRYRIEVFGTAANRLTPEFARTKTEANLRKRQLRESGIIATVFNIGESGSLTR